MAERIRYVGDIHGQLDKLEQALDFPGKVIFVGDFVDSYRTTVADQILCIERVLQSIAAGHAEAVFGNHEMSYLNPLFRCSGWNSATEERFNSGLGDRIRAAFKPFIWENDVLVTHAGITKGLWEDYNLSKENLAQTLTEWYHHIDSPYYQVGRARGGWKKYGGPLWCDWSEFKPVEGLTQVVGHSRGSGIRVKDHSYCIDVLENITGCEFLELDGPNIRP